MFSCLVVVVLGAATAAATVLGAADHCARDTLPPLDQGLRFTKELPEREFALGGGFKALHCCAASYLSIQWWKDGRAYPWPGDVSSLILYPESANQTLYTRSLRPQDAGDYFCTARNESSLLSHSTSLTVLEGSGYMEVPLATFKPEPLTRARKAHPARLYCEAFVGFIDLPDAESEASWEKEGNSSFLSDRVKLQHVIRDGELTVGAYLLFESVEPSDFGKYLCTISNTGDQKITLETLLVEWQEESDSGADWRKAGRLIAALLSVSASSALLFVLLSTYIRYSYFNKDLSKIWKRDKRAPNGRVVFVFAGPDQALVDTILSTNTSSLTLIPHNLTAQGVPRERGARQLVLLSPALVTAVANPTWSKESIATALSSFPHASLLTTTKGLPQGSEEVTRRLRLVPWDMAKPSGFWLQLASSAHPPTSPSPSEAHV